MQNELNFEEFYNSATYPLSSQYIAALKRPARRTRQISRPRRHPDRRPRRPPGQRCLRALAIRRGHDGRSQKPPVSTERRRRSAGRRGAGVLFGPRLRRRRRDQCGREPDELGLVGQWLDDQPGGGYPGQREGLRRIRQEVVDDRDQRRKSRVALPRERLSERGGVQHRGETPPGTHRRTAERLGVLANDGRHGRSAREPSPMPRRWRVHPNLSRHGISSRSSGREPRV